MKIINCSLPPVGLELTERLEPAAPVAAAGPAAWGVEVGTSSVVSAAPEAEGGIVLRREHNAFLEMIDEPFTRRYLTGLEIPFVVEETALLVVGEAAVDVARCLGREVQRPMLHGILNPAMPRAAFFLKGILERTLGGSSRDGERLAYSIPGEFDGEAVTDSDLIYHRGIVDGILSRLGYRPTAVNEGLAVVLSELKDEDFTGLGLSFGAGLTSVCLAHRGLQIESFSIPLGGDWVDSTAAATLGISTVDAAAIKERGIDMRRPETREQHTIVTLLENLVSNVVERMRERFAASARRAVLRAPITAVVTGGTSKARGFSESVLAEIAKPEGFPIPIREIRPATEPDTSVARGCLAAAVLAECGACSP